MNGGLLNVYYKDRLLIGNLKLKYRVIALPSNSLAALGFV